MAAIPFLGIHSVVEGVTCPLPLLIVLFFYRSLKKQLVNGSASLDLKCFDNVCDAVPRHRSSIHFGFKCFNRTFDGFCNIRKSCFIDFGNTASVIEIASRLTRIRVKEI